MRALLPVVVEVGLCCPAGDIGAIPLTIPASKAIPSIISISSESSHISSAEEEAPSICALIFVFMSSPSSSFSDEGEGGGVLVYQPDSTPISLKSPGAKPLRLSPYPVNVIVSPERIVSLDISYRTPSW